MISCMESNGIICCHGRNPSKKHQDVKSMFEKNLYSKNVKLFFVDGGHGLELQTELQIFGTEVLMM